MAEPPPRQRFPVLIVRYAMVGVLGALVHVSSTVLLVELLSMDPVLASVVGFVLTVLVSFYLNSRWTFGVPVGDPGRLFKYSVVSIMGLLLNTFIMYVTVDVWEWHYRVGLALVVVVIPLHNFTLNYYWSYRDAT